MDHHPRLGWPFSALILGKKPKISEGTGATLEVLLKINF
jgi:hypothetical protein